MKKPGRTTIFLFLIILGVTLAGDLLYVADTNNRTIRILDLSTRKATTLKI